MPTPAELDVDARFLLANERTLLAWVRTSLALLAVGVGLLGLVDRPGRVLPGVLLLLLAATSAGVGVRRFLVADRALRAGSLPPAGRSPVLLGGGLVLLCLALVVVALTGGLDPRP